MASDLVAFLTDPLVRRLINDLQTIAYGRTDNGRALGGEIARTLARKTLADLSIDWSVRGKAAIPSPARGDGT